ncbi:MAG TPA: hypothetical protein PKZ75_15220 [Bacteroidia bacterium]|nr:hypothetical protein [Bacteroidia bacterium]
MSKSIILSIIALLSLTSCLKKTECSGYVYSKYNIPVAGKSITLLDRLSSTREERSSVVATTDNNGYYHFSFKTKRNHTYSITTEDILNGIQPLKESQVNNIDIYLAK